MFTANNIDLKAVLDYLSELSQLKKDNYYFFTRLNSDILVLQALILLFGLLCELYAKYG
jgi:hypothetical protein